MWKTHSQTQTWGENISGLLETTETLPVMNPVELSDSPLAFHILSPVFYCCQKQTSPGLWLSGDVLRHELYTPGVCACVQVIDSKQNLGCSEWQWPESLDLFSFIMSFIIVVAAWYERIKKHPGTQKNNRNFSVHTKKTYIYFSVSNKRSINIICSVCFTSVYFVCSSAHHSLHQIEERCCSNHKALYAL